MIIFLTILIMMPITQAPLLFFCGWIILPSPRWRKSCNAKRTHIPEVEPSQTMLCSLESCNFSSKEPQALFQILQKPVFQRVTCTRVCFPMLEEWPRDGIWSVHADHCAHVLYTRDYGVGQRWDWFSASVEWVRTLPGTWLSWMLWQHVLRRKCFLSSLRFLWLWVEEAAL